MIRKERLATRIGELARIGALKGGGTTRLALTEEYRRGLALIRQWMEEAGMSVRMDAAANLIGRLGAKNVSAKPVVIGSHVDTVKNAGNYDGVIGVIGGIEVAAHIAEEGIAISRPLDVVAFSEEEGARFGSGVFGSRAMAGCVTSDDLQVRDADGISRGEAITAFGGDPGKIPGARPGPEKVFHVYLELHIEQGPVLESRGAALGVVEGIVGMMVSEITWTGESNHAGATPMGMRHDALLGACELACEVERLCTTPGCAVLGTVGVMDVFPGGVNIVPGRVSMTMDIRDLRQDVLERTHTAVEEAAAAIAARRGLGVTFKPRMKVAPAPCDATARARIERACRDLGCGHMNIVSGAGHDAQLMSLLADIGMIFVRSTGGGHNPAEYAAPEDIALGTEALARTALEYLQQPAEHKKESYP